MIVINTRWQTGPAAINGDRGRWRWVSDRSANGGVAMQRGLRISARPMLPCLVDDHREVTDIVLRTRGVDQLTEPVHVEPGTAEVFRCRAVDTSHGR